VEVQEDYREGKNFQPDMKHMPKSIESAHNQLDRVLHFFRSHRLVGNKERKVSIIVLPPQALFGKQSVLLLESLGQLRAGYGDWKQNLDRVYLGLFDESPKISFAFLGGYPDERTFLKGIPKNISFCFFSNFTDHPTSAVRMAARAMKPQFQAWISTASL